MRRGNANLVGGVIGARRAIRRGKIALVQKAQYAVKVEVSVQHDIGIVQTVMACVRVQIPLIGQLRNGARMPTRLELVTRAREQRRVHRVIQHAIGVGQGALHLVEHHAVIAQRLGCVALSIVQLKVPALLLEDGTLAINHRMQHGIHVHIHQIEQVLIVGTRHRIHGLIGERERVQKRLHRGLEQVHERLFDRKLVGAAQNRVFENVEHAGVVGGRRLKRNGERLVLVLVLQKQQAGAAFLVAHHVRCAVDLVQRLALHRAEPVSSGNGANLVGSEHTCLLISRGKTRSTINPMPAPQASSCNARDYSAAAQHRAATPHFR